MLLLLAAKTLKHFGRYAADPNTSWAGRKEGHMTSQFQEGGIRLETELADLASKNPNAGRLLNEYRSTEKHAHTALTYVLQHGEKRGYILPQAVKLETQPTLLMTAYAARDSMGLPLIYVNAGLRFYLIMLNYSLALAAFKNTALGGWGMNATLFSIVNGYWPPSVDLLSEIEAMGEFSEDELYFITAWIPSQMFFVVAHEFAHHLIWRDRQDSAQVQNVHLPTGKEIEVYLPSQEDEIRADEIVFDIWDELNATLSSGFRALTAGGIGALFGYFGILEEYTQPEQLRSNLQPATVDRYERLKARLSNTGRTRSLRAMEETWAETRIMKEICIEAREALRKQAKEEN